MSLKSLVVVVGCACAQRAVPRRLMDMMKNLSVLDGSIGSDEAFTNEEQDVHEKRYLEADTHVYDQVSSTDELDAKRGDLSDFDNNTCDGSQVLSIEEFDVNRSSSHESRDIMATNLEDDEKEEAVEMLLENRRRPDLPMEDTKPYEQGFDEDSDYMSNNSNTRLRPHWMQQGRGMGAQVNRGQNFMSGGSRNHGYPHEEFQDHCGSGSSKAAASELFKKGWDLLKEKEIDGGRTRLGNFYQKKAKGYLDDRVKNIQKARQNLKSVLETANNAAKQYCAENKDKVKFPYAMSMWEDSRAGTNGILTERGNVPKLSRYVRNAKWSARPCFSNKNTGGTITFDSIKKHLLEAQEAKDAFDLADKHFKLSHAYAMSSKNNQKWDGWFHWHKKCMSKYRASMRKKTELECVITALELFVWMNEDRKQPSELPLSNIVIPASEACQQENRDQNNHRDYPVRGAYQQENWALP